MTPKTCTRSCLRSELGKRDPLFEALAENARLRAAGTEMLNLLTLDGDPPAVAVPQECETPEEINRFTTAYDNLSKAVAPTSAERG